MGYEHSSMGDAVGRQQQDTGANILQRYTLYILPFTHSQQVMFG